MDETLRPLSGGARSAGGAAGGGIGSAEPAIRAIALMVEHRVRTIPVVMDTAGGLAVVGVLTRSDLAAALKA